MNEKNPRQEQVEDLRSPRPTPRVFVSYSHESADHKNWVLRLASDLRRQGIDAILDVWDLKPGEDVTRFMEHLASVDRVVIVCSEEYARKAAAGKGGVGYETMLVTAEILQDRGSVKFIPILKNNPSKALPPFLRSRVWIDFERDADYSAKVEELARVLHAAPSHPKPALGPNPYSTGGSTSRHVLEDAWFGKHQSAAKPDVEARGAFMEIAFGVSNHPIKTDHRSLLNIAERSAIHTFGWPIGVVLHVDDKAPKADTDGIVARIVSHGFSDYERYDYWALRLNGDFYLAQNLFENGMNPKAIFFNTRMVRAAEALLYCRNLYKNLGLEEEATVQFRLRHCGIASRILSSSTPNRMMMPFERKSSADVSEKVIEFSLPLTDRGVVERTRELLDPLFVLFDFFAPAESIYEDVVGNFIQGRCT
jgi:hypothetical protein